MGRNPLHPGILDAQFLPEEGQFVVQTVDLGPAPSPAVSIVRGAGDHGCEGVVAEGQDLEDGGLGPALPAAREGDLAMHRGLRELPVTVGISEV